MKDYVFGDIEYDYGWRGSYSFSIFGRSYSVALVISCDEDEEIEPTQREAFIQFELAKDRITNTAAREVYDYYLGISDDIRERVGPKLEAQFAPKIEHVDDLSNIVTPTDLLIKQSSGGIDRTIGLLFDCSWDPGHGLAVKIKNEIVVEVGAQDIVL